MNIDFLECPACGGYGVLNDGRNCVECGGTEHGVGSGDVMVDRDSGRRITTAELVEIARKLRPAAAGGPDAR